MQDMGQAEADGRPIGTLFAAHPDMAIPATTIWTVGHSTLRAGAFLDLLLENRIEILADVRRFPGSRRFPQFNEKSLCEALAPARIRYVHLAELGGRRPVRPDSRNLGWRNASFRGYADYMETPAFLGGIGRLLELAGSGRTAMMCAEAVWWRCHRSLIADYLKSTGIRVVHILGPHSVEDHPYTPAARLVDGRLSYEGAAGEASLPLEEDIPVTVFKVGDHVEWNSEAGRVRGTVTRKVTAPMEFRGYTVHASKEELQYLIKSDKTEHLAMHKGSALKKVEKEAKGSPTS